MAASAKMMRAVPEMMIIVKGMMASVRSVCITSLLLSMMTYVLSISPPTATPGTALARNTTTGSLHGLAAERAERTSQQNTITYSVAIRPARRMNIGSRH